MVELSSDRRRPSAWARLTEDRFTNIDIILVLGALAITSVVGAVSGVALLG